MNYLLIVEGEKAEPKLFESIFSRYGFSVVRHPRPDSLKDYCFDPDLAVNFSEVEIRDEEVRFILFRLQTIALKDSYTKQ